MSNLHNAYTAGFDALLSQLGAGHSRYAEVLTYQQRLGDILVEEQEHSDSEFDRIERRKILAQVNELSLAVLGVSFDTLCGLGSSAAEPVVGALIGVPDLPPHYLRRAAELARLKRTLFDEVGNVVMTGTTGGKTDSTTQQDTNNPDGIGGIGKSVLATALAWEPDVQRFFPDGIIWVTLGANPPLTVKQAWIARSLGDYRGTYEDVHTGRASLSILLAKKACLIILDDAWQAAHIAAFGTPGPRSRLLITTRHTGLVQTIGANEYHLDVLSKEQALRLLSLWTGHALETLPETTHDIVAECGYLPLALAMVGAMIRNKANPWAYALSRLRSVGLETFHQSFPDCPSPHALRATQVCLESLPTSVQRCYCSFGVFPEGVSIPETVLHTFWEHDSLSPDEIRDILDTLVNRSLLLSDEQGHLHLHNLQHRYIRQRGEELATLHTRLLDAYRAPLGERGWPALPPNDPYIWHHLDDHLIGAGREEELISLLLTFDWLQAKLRTTDINALITSYTNPFLRHNGASSPLRLIRDTLRLSAHVLLRDKSQLAGQLSGRLLSCTDKTIQAMLARIQPGGDSFAMLSTPWLRPLYASLNLPGSSMMRSLKGYGDRLSAVALTSDGKQAAAKGYDGTLRVWDVESEQIIASLSFTGERILAIAFSENGKQVIAASDDGSLKVWNVAEPATEPTDLVGQRGNVRAVALATEGTQPRAIAGTSEGTLHVWDLASGQLLSTIPAPPVPGNSPEDGHSQPILAVASGASGQYALAGFSNGRIAFYALDGGEAGTETSTETGTIMATFEGHREAVRDVALSNDGSKAVSASSDRTLKVWDTHTGQLLATLDGHSAGVRAVALSTSGEYAVSASADGTLKLWSIVSGQTLQTLDARSDLVWAVAFSSNAPASNNQQLVSAATDGTVKIWDIGPGASAAMEAGERREAGIMAMALSDDGQRVAAVTSSGALNVWHLPPGVTTESAPCQEPHQHDTMQEAGSPDAWAVALSGNGKRALVGLADGTLTVWDVPTKTTIASLEGHRSGVRTLALSNDGNRAISSSDDGTINVWDVEQGQIYAVLEGSTSRLMAVALSDDGRRAMAATADGWFSVWDIEQGTLPQQQRKGDMEKVEAIALAKNGQQALSASQDGTLKVWNTATGQNLATMGNARGWVVAVALCARNNRAVSISADGTLAVWDTEREHHLASYNTDGLLLACAIAPDGKTVVAGERSGRVHMLRLEGI